MTLKNRFNSHKEPSNATGQNKLLNWLLQQKTRRDVRRMDIKKWLNNIRRNLGKTNGLQPVFPQASQHPTTLCQ